MEDILLRKLIAVVMFVFLTSPIWAEPNPSDYTLKVHVISSRLELHLSGGTPSDSEVLRVLIDGKEYDLDALPIKISFGSFGVIVPRDYKAKIVDEKDKSSYLFTRTYEFLFPDQTTMKFRVIGQTE
jgi:hypothetical protein